MNELQPVKMKVFLTISNLIVVVNLLSLATFQSSSPAASGLIGSPAPYFRVQSGDDKELTLDMIKGKVIAIFYETKDIVENNQRLKDELNKLYYEQTGIVKDVLVRLHYRLFGCILAFPGDVEKKTQGIL